MVEQAKELDFVFGSLSDPTRRDILRQVSKRSLSVGQIAVNYPLTFAAVAKHLDVLHRAKLITKSRQGKEQIVSIAPDTLLAATKYLGDFQQLWQNRLDALDKYLESTNKKKKGRI